MGFFEEFTSEVKDIFQTGEKKVNDAINVQKLRMDINNLNKRIDETYRKIGKAAWDKKEDPAFACFWEEFEELERLIGALGEYADQLARAKGQARCPECGCFNQNDAQFCNQCGKNL